METFSALLAICAGNSPVAGDFFDLILNKRLSKHSWGWRFETPTRPLWRHCKDISRAHCIGAHKRTLPSHTLQWRHNGRGSVSNHQPHDCLLNRWFRRRSKKTSKLRRGPVNSPHKWPVTRKMFPFDDVIMHALYLYMRLFVILEHVANLIRRERWFHSPDGSVANDLHLEGKPEISVALRVYFRCDVFGSFGGGSSERGCGTMQMTQNWQVWLMFKIIHVKYEINTNTQS